MMACFRGDLDMMRLVLAAGSDVEARTTDQETALHIAAEWGIIEVVRELIVAHTANMFAVDEDGKTPFDFACRSEQTLGVSELLLEIYGNKMTADHGRFALHEILKVAVHPPLNPLRIQLPLGKLTVQHWRTLMQTLDRELIWSRDDSGKLPIHIACRTNAPVEILVMLVDLDSATLQIADHNGSLPLHDCCFGAVNHSSVRYLVEQGGIGTLTARNGQRLLPLHVLCGSTNPSLRTIQNLIQSFPSSVSMRSHADEYPFMIAAGDTSSASLSVVYELVRASLELVAPR